MVSRTKGRVRRAQASDSVGSVQARTVGITARQGGRRQRARRVRGGGHPARRRRQAGGRCNGTPPPPPSQATRFRVTVIDNGPGIVRQQIPPIFAKLLYGSKFHRLRMSRGQQGIGISAAGMYAQLTTGKPVQIISRTGARAPAHYFEVQIDTKKNEPRILENKKIDWENQRGTQVTLEIEGPLPEGAARRWTSTSSRWPSPTRT